MDFMELGARAWSKEGHILSDVRFRAFRSVSEVTYSGSRSTSTASLTRKTTRTLGKKFDKERKSGWSTTTKYEIPSFIN